MNILETLKLARQALEQTATDLHHDNFETEEAALVAIDFAIEELEKQGEPERCHGCEACINTACGRDECPKGWPKAPQPAQKPLTDEQIKEMWLQLNPQALVAFARAIEAAHGIKENT